MNSRCRSVPGRTIALAGLFQATGLVQQVGNGSNYDIHAVRTSLLSILVTDPVTIDDVYPDRHALHYGLSLLAQQLGSNAAARNLELTGYAVTLLHLERRLQRNAVLLEQLSTGIAQLRGHMRPEEPEHPDTVAALAELYRTTISTLRPRIMVRGDQQILSVSGNQQLVRALLLAGMRAAVLWRQCGGSRFRLLFERTALLRSCKALLEEDRRLP